MNAAKVSLPLVSQIQEAFQPSVGAMNERMQTMFARLCKIAALGERVQNSIEPELEEITAAVEAIQATLNVDETPQATDERPSPRRSKLKLKRERQAPKSQAKTNNEVVRQNVANILTEQGPMKSGDLRIAAGDGMNRFVFLTSVLKPLLANRVIRMDGRQGRTTTYSIVRRRK